MTLMNGEPCWQTSEVLETSEVCSTERCARQALFAGIGEEGQLRLSQATAVVVGCGATGSVLANHLVRAGVGRVRIVDRDYVEWSNLSRQMLFDEDDARAGTPKAIAAGEKLRRINSSVQVESVVADANADNIEELLGDANLALDGTDNFETRYLLNDACLKLDTRWIYCGAVASYGMTMTVIPRQTACLRCVFSSPPGPGAAETCDTVGVVNAAVGAIASLAAGEALKLLTGRGTPNPGLIYLDLWENTYERIATRRRDDCPACAQGRYDYLRAEAGSRLTSLCGRNAVQVRASSGQALSFPLLAKKLAPVGQVSFNEHVLRFRANGYEMTLFPDARAIIKGTDDPAVARSLYARYIGN